MQGRFEDKSPGDLGAHVGGCGCVRAFGQRRPGSEKICGFVGKTAGHPPCGNFSPCKKLFPHPPSQKTARPKEWPNRVGSRQSRIARTCARAAAETGYAAGDLRLMLGVSPAPQRCPVSAWWRSWPLLWGGSPWDTRSCWREMTLGAVRPLLVC